MICKQQWHGCSQFNSSSHVIIRIFRSPFPSFSCGCQEMNFFKALGGGEATVFFHDPRCPWLDENLHPGGHCIDRARSNTILAVFCLVVFRVPNKNRCVYHCLPMFTHFLLQTCVASSVSWRSLQVADVAANAYQVIMSWTRLIQKSFKITWLGKATWPMSQVHENNYRGSAPPAPPYQFLQVWQPLGIIGFLAVMLNPYLGKEVIRWTWWTWWSFPSTSVGNCCGILKWTNWFGHWESACFIWTRSGFLRGLFGPSTFGAESLFARNFGSFHVFCVFIWVCPNI